MSRFADIAVPLHHLTQKDIQFSWNKECNESFQCLKKSLTEAPILAFPHFDLHASPFILQTDASAGGLGAILQQDGHVIAYASRVLNKAECKNSVIQRECLAAVHGSSAWHEAVKALPDGRPFELWTDHEPLKVVGKPKVGGNAGTLGTGSAGVLSLLCTAEAVRTTILTHYPCVETQVWHGHTSSSCNQGRHANTIDLHPSSSEAGPGDQAGRSGITIVNSSNNSQLVEASIEEILPIVGLKDGNVRRYYTPGPTSDPVTVPVFPATDQKEALQQCRESPQAGQQGEQKTLY